MLPELLFLRRQERYDQLLMVLRDLLAEGGEEISNLSMIASYLNVYMERLNWVGFYLYRNDALVVGPYQGNPACIRIEMGRGVCGKAAHEQRMINVPDVHDFPGYISCDSATRSEIVLPIRNGTTLYGVLDIDSPELDRFMPEDESMLKEVVKLFEEYLVRDS